MPSEAGEREAAVAAAEGSCPRCGSPRAVDDEYCLECGLRLPPVGGRIGGLRRRWIRRVGWYPGDFVWASLLALLVAAAGAATAIAVTHGSGGAGGSVYTATRGAVAVREPTAVPTGPSPGVDTSTLPTAPEPTVGGPAVKPPRNGRLTWPANENGWTIVLVSYPRTNGRRAALAAADRAARSLRQVGVLDSGRFPSLQPGYFVVFAGIYGSKSDADAAVATARQVGFGGAYSRQIAR